MKIAYAGHPGRPPYEIDGLSALPSDEVRILDTRFDRYPQPPPAGVTYCSVDSWDAGVFGSTARLVRYRGFERFVEDVDVVFVLEVFSSISHQLIRYCGPRGIPVVVLTYELISRHPLYRLPPFSYFTRVVMRGAASFVAVTRSAKRHAVALGATGDSVAVIPPGVDVDRFSPSTAPQRETGVLFVGLLERHKGADVVLETFRSVVRPHADRFMTIVGDGTGRPAVEAAAQKSRNLRFFPHVPRVDMPEVYRRHDVLVLPARDTVRFGLKIGAEQFGFALVEAMACGLAVVASDSGAIRDIVGDANPVCSQNQLQTFPATVEEALSQAEALRDLGQANRARATRLFDVRIQAQQLFDWLQGTAIASKS